MAQLLVRNLDDAVKERLRVVAAAHGRSMEEEARVILHTALAETVLPTSGTQHVGLGDRIQALLMDVDFPDEYFEALDEIRRGSDLIDAEPRAAKFDE